MLLIIGAKYQWEPAMAQQRWICDLILLVLPVFIVTPRKEQKVGQHEWIPESGSCFACPRFGTVTKFCKAHGGGKRCTVLGCTKGAEGSTAFCKAYGGGKRCSFQDGGVCSKGVHGGTLFCVVHGGGKRCAVAEFAKSARGQTDFCVRHGGGKRCKSEGCGKSAQGSTDFCKAHGGGKRSSWGQVGSDFGAGGSACDRFARGKTGLCGPGLRLLCSWWQNTGTYHDQVPSWN